MTILCQQLVKVADALCAAVGSDVARTVQKLVRAQDIQGLANLRLDPSCYDDAEVFKRDYCVASLFRKLDVPGEKGRLDQEALALWFETERNVAITNVRFNRFRHNGPFEDPDEIRALSVLDRARDYIRRVLGSLPRDLDGRFGPGATYGDKGHYTTVPDKMSTTPTITSAARALLPLLEGTAWFRAHEHRTSGMAYLEDVRGCRFTTVPKDATKRRAIAIEPSCNVFLQLAVGSYMKRKLLLAGIDLIHGQESHQVMARQGSTTGHLATIDLSCASDTVSLELVRYLLPTEWVTLLEMLRSPFIRLPSNKWARLEKFSSMGNGFTFELESLIFASLAYAVGAGDNGRQFSVFGDDIIVHTDVATDVLAVLAFCGFTPNSRKTFISGDFRESCGGDFFKGVRVTPHYLKEIPHEPQHWISLANGIRRLVDEDRYGPLRYHFPFTAWLRCLDPIPVHIRRLRGPQWLGDLVVHDDRGWQTRCDHNGTRFIRTYRPVFRALEWFHWKPDVVFASALYGLPGLGVIPRRDGSEIVVGYKVSEVPLWGIGDDEPLLKFIRKSA